MDLETFRELQQRGRFFSIYFPARRRQRNGCGIVTNSSASINTARVRRRLPRISRPLTCLANSQAQLDGIAQRLNIRSRMTLGYRTPAAELAEIVATTGLNTRYRCLRNGPRESGSPHWSISATG